MQSVLSPQAFGNVSPAWLRPGALILVTFTHLAFLIGIPWPTATDIATPFPLNVEVVPQGEQARALAPVESHPVAEVRPSDAMTGEVQSVDSIPSIGEQETVESKPDEQRSTKPPERLADVTSPTNASPLSAQPATESKPLDVARAASARIEPAVREMLRVDEPVIDRPPEILARAQPPAPNLEAVRVQQMSPLGAAPPIREVATAEPVAREVNPPTRATLPAFRAVTELESAEVQRAIAPMPVTPQLRETPPEETLARAVNPLAERPLEPAQLPVTELELLEVPVTADPDQIEPTIREMRVAEASPVTPEVQPPLPEPPQRTNAPSSVASTASGSGSPTAQGTSGANTDATAATNYRALIVAELNRRKRYPEEARQARASGTVMVSFTIETSGRVSSISLMKSSGHNALDGAVRQMLNVVSLPPPPGGAIRVTVPVQFKMTP
jgi:periplasmic protein TonB